MDMISACFEAAEQHAELENYMNVLQGMGILSGNCIRNSCAYGAWLFMRMHYSRGLRGLGPRPKGPLWPRTW
jgi:hypothetical protein